MVLYRQHRRATRDDIQTFVERMRGSGIPHPERISGFPGLFFSVGDVYLSDQLAVWSKQPDLAAFLDDIIARFSKEDYGEISESARSENVESRWLGNGSYMIGRYPYKDTVLYIKTLENYTYVHDECDVAQVPNRIDA